VTLLRSGLDDERLTWHLKLSPADSLDLAVDAAVDAAVDLGLRKRRTGGESECIA